MNSPLNFVRPLGLAKDDPRKQRGDFLSKNEALRYEEPELLETDGDLKIIPNNSVKMLELLKRQRFNSGQVSRYEVTMRNGARYHILDAHPHEPTTDVSISSTTAWLTGIDGMNTRFLLAQMKAGIPASLLSTARQAGYKPSLEQGAHNQLAIAKHLAELSSERDEVNLALFGISRAAMIGKGANALAEQHDVNIMHSTLLGPCYPRPFSLSQLGRYSHIVSDEVKSAVGMAKIPPSALRHYLSTLDTTPAGIRYAIATIPELTSGNAGNFARAMPENTSAYVLGFEGDVMSDIHEYERILHNRPNIVFDIRPGGAHTSLTHESVYQEYKRSLNTLPDELENAKAHGERKLGRAAIERIYEPSQVAA